jgi:hypothetical protein
VWWHLEEAPHKGLFVGSLGLGGSICSLQALFLEAVKVFLVLENTGLLTCLQLLHLHCHFLEYEPAERTKLSRRTALE